ncbi:MAG: OmpH family outer membrane protein [Geobacteraceae bacterium]|nr:OmpH family outer membrane protein [Geobacteraceae bacterium]
MMVATLAALFTASAWAEEPAAPPASKAAPPVSAPTAETQSTVSAPAAPLPLSPSKVEQAVKIGYVDMAKIASDSAPGKAVQKEIKARTDKYQSQIKTKEKQLEKLKKTIEAQAATLSPQQREAKAKEFQKNIDEYRKLVIKADKDVSTLQEKLLGELYTSVEKAAGDYGKTNGFAAVVMKKELLYSAETAEVKDLTAEIIKLVESRQSKK